MRVLCTFPGRYGDILWALPTVRAVSEAIDEPVDLQIAGEFASIVPLLKQQPYLANVWGADDWSLSHPEIVPLHEHYERVFHLSYAGWPMKPLPFTIHDRLVAQWGQAPTIDLRRPWITVNGAAIPVEVVGGFTEAWFELKLGIAISLERQLQFSHLFTYLTIPDSRWTTEASGLSVYPCNWLDAARVIRNSDLFFGDCSALHVLACALGQRCVICEPMEGRWNDIFYPYGKTGPEVTLVLGNDGNPTFDARACAEALRVR